MVLKELIFNSLHFWKVWWFLKELVLTVSTLGGCGGLERTDFNSFYFGRAWIFFKLSWLADPAE